LARDGLIQTDGRHGTIVLSGRNRSTTRTDLDAAADALAIVTRQLGLDPDHAHRALDKALDRI
jgi:hypothetical protein